MSDGVLRSLLNLVGLIVADIRALEIAHGTNWMVADIKTLEIAHGTNWIVADI